MLKLTQDFTQTKKEILVCVAKTPVGVGGRKKSLM